MKKELFIMLGCFAVAFIINVIAIIRFSTPWTEMFTQIGYVCIITGVLYVIVTLLRILYWLISLIAQRIRARR